MGAELERRKRGQSFAEQAGEWSGSLRLFLEHAWSDGLGMAEAFTPGWHIDAMCEHLEALAQGEIRRLAIAVPPGSTKSTVASIVFPVWLWTRDPRLRFLTASYHRRLAERFSVKSRDLMRTAWFQDRWGHMFWLKADENLKSEYANNRGGRRLAIPANTGTGEHADVIVIDDAHNVKDVVSDAIREATIEWHDGTVTTRFTRSEAGAEVIIGQRIHEKDLIGHVLAMEPEEWTVLCLPERFEPRHPQRTSARVRLPSGRTIAGDARELEGEMLCPGRVSEAENVVRARRLGAFRAAGQLQQRPAAREGAILKRSGWRFFPASFLEDDQRHRLPRFTQLLQSWDTAFKDRTVNDFVAGGLWGVYGADLYFLASRVERMNLSATKQAIRDMTSLAERWFPDLPLRILVEKRANGVEVLQEMQRELRGLVPTNPDASKTARAEAAEPTLESGHVFVPGERSLDDPSGYDQALTPAFAAALIEQAATFPFGENDDNVDQFTQVVNWTRGAGRRSRATLARPQGVMPVQGSMVPGSSVEGSGVLERGMLSPSAR